MNIDKVGFIDKGTGEHQSNVVYGLCESSVSPTLTAGSYKSPPMILINICYANHTHTA